MQEKIPLELRKAITENHALLCHSRVKLAILLGSTIFPAFAALDSVFAPDLFRLFLTLRLAIGVEGLCFLIALQLSRRTSAMLSCSLMVFFGFTIQAVIAYMCFRLGGFSSPYYTGLLVVLLGISVIMPWHPLFMLMLNLLTYGAYLSQFFVVGWNAPIGIFAVHNFFLVCSFFLTLIGSLLGYRLHMRLLTSNEELKSLSEFKSQMMSMVSHDLRGPLAILNDTLGVLLERDWSSKEKPADLIHRGEEGIRRMLGLINQLLNYHRLEGGKIPLDKKRFDLRDLVTELIDLWRPLAVRNGQELFLGEVKGELEIEADRRLLGQVVENLVRNAIRHTPSGGSISLTLVGSQNQVCCFVSDTGSGIAPEIMPRLFNQFTKHASEGLGLGLFIARRLVELHGGDIEVESNPGRGTTFKFTLPKTPVK